MDSINKLFTWLEEAGIIKKKTVAVVCILVFTGGIIFFGGREWERTANKVDYIVGQVEKIDNIEHQVSTNSTNISSLAEITETLKCNQDERLNAYSTSDIVQMMKDVTYIKGLVTKMSEA